MRVSGVGCCVVDLLHDVPAGQDRLGPWLSRRRGDGGLVRGGATLKSAFERFAGRSVEAWAGEVLGDVAPRRSLGGVCLVSAVAAAQLLPARAASVRLLAHVPDDRDGDWILERLAATPLDRTAIRRRPGRFPTTLVLNERTREGAWERTFIADPGMPDALALDPADLDDGFFSGDVAVFGAAWWEPRLFARLAALTARCERAGALAVVGTAFDPSRALGGGRWPIGDSDEVYRHVDVLVVNATEAWVYSGERELDGALAFFRRSGVGACVVTDGLRPVHHASWGRACAPGEGVVPVPRAIVEDQARGALATGDTVGCGDNFLGGLVASLALQRRRGGAVDLGEAVRLASLSGALASTHPGGVFPERRPGEKRELVERYRAAYDAQLRAEGRGH